jgi:TatA/E family protein of Tat protein translocase
MFGTIGGPELFLILVIALIVFGPKKLPEIGKSLGRMMIEFKKATAEFQQTVEREIEADKLKSYIENPNAIEAPKPIEPPAAAPAEAPIEVKAATPEADTVSRGSLTEPTK